MLIREGTIVEVVELSKQLPEFVDPHGAEVYEHRLSNVPHLILLAEVDGQKAGFKVGYERDGSFYSWMGGVLPAFRRKGLAKALANAQEEWAKTAGYQQITFKTRNQHKGMLLFALQNGFNIIGFKAHSDIAQHRILLQKQL